MPTIAFAPTVHLALSHWCHHCWWPGVRPGWLMGWLTLALINAGLAQTKNRSGLFWFLLSLVVGPVATLLLITLFARRFQT